jgi:hypothetical protein
LDLVNPVLIQVIQTPATVLHKCNPVSIYEQMMPPFVERMEVAVAIMNIIP